MHGLDAMPGPQGESEGATNDFQISTGRVVEMGTQVTIQGRDPASSA
jgi:hypothetical protein